MLQSLLWLSRDQLLVLGWPGSLAYKSDLQIECLSESDGFLPLTSCPWLLSCPFQVLFQPQAAL